MKPQLATRALLAIVFTCVSSTAVLLLVAVGRTPQEHAPPSPTLSAGQSDVTQRQSATYVAVAPSQVGGGHRIYIVQPGGMRG